MYLGDSTPSGYSDTYLVQQLHALAIAISQAKDRNDKTDAAALLLKFRQLADLYRQNGTSDMTAWDNFVLATGQWIATSVDAIPSAIAALPGAVGEGLIRAAIPYALLFLGYLYLRSRAARG